MSSHTNAILEQGELFATITLRSENGVNVASIPFLNELESVVDTLAKDRSVRFVAICAEGKVFLAGADIKAMASIDSSAARDMAVLGHRVFGKLESLPQVTVALIHGACLGGGCELVMACDFRFAVASANIGQPEVLLGLIPGWGGTSRLPRLVGHNQARRMMISGDSVNGEEALRIGLVDGTAKNAEELQPQVTAFFDDLVKTSPSAVASVKRCLSGADEIDAFASGFDGSEAREGMAAFIDRRPPSWST
jgi:enoyl-CoA hydratase/carnithine racemase